MGWIENRDSAAHAGRSHLLRSATGTLATHSSATAPAPLVAVIGGGCSGTLVAANLLRRAGGPLRVAIFERSGVFGPGVAYSTADADHLLNVPAERMSAFCEQPLHFAGWAARRLGELAPASYLPRRLYGEYLQSVLHESSRAAAPGRTLELIHGEVLAARRSSRGLELELADGRRMLCDRVVLATGPREGARPAVLPDDPRVILDPWAPGVLAAGAKAGPTLVLGTGLSGVDSMLSVCAAGGRVIALSRNGRLPRGHLPGLRCPAPPPLVPGGPVSLGSLERLLAEHARAMEEIGYDWRDVIDGLRPVTGQLWSLLAPRQRRRFLAERRREWDVRRHRMAPFLGARLQELMAAGQVEQLTGELIEVRSAGPDLRVRVALGRSGRVRLLSARRIVVCTGAGADIRAPGSPLLDSLFEGGLASPDSLGLGLRTSEHGELRDSRGVPARDMLTLGALRLGELWETTAVDQIRVQAEGLAEAIERSLRRRSGASPQKPSGADGPMLDQHTRLLVGSGPDQTEVPR